MITKERLEELIEQGITVCNAYKDWDNNWHCRYGKVVQEENSLLFKENGSSLSVIIHNTYNLYETKEQAEWEWEFGCIERTERLELPTWEEFIEMEEFCFFQKNHKQTIIRVLGTKYLGLETNFERYYTGDLTKENYILACRKAKELFLGQSNNS